MLDGQKNRQTDKQKSVEGLTNRQRSRKIERWIE